MTPESNNKITISPYFHPQANFPRPLPEDLERVITELYFTSHPPFSQESFYGLLVCKKWNTFFKNIKSLEPKNLIIEALKILSEPQTDLYLSKCSEFLKESFNGLLSRQMIDWSDFSRVVSLWNNNDTYKCNFNSYKQKKLHQALPFLLLDHKKELPCRDPSDDNDTKSLYFLENLLDQKKYDLAVNYINFSSNKKPLLNFMFDKLGSSLILKLLINYGFSVRVLLNAQLDDIKGLEYQNYRDESLETSPFIQSFNYMLKFHKNLILGNREPNSNVFNHLLRKIREHGSAFANKPELFLRVLVTCTSKAYPNNSAMMQEEIRQYFKYIYLFRDSHPRMFNIFQSLKDYNKPLFLESFNSYLEIFIDRAIRYPNLPLREDVNLTMLSIRYAISVNNLSCNEIIDHYIMLYEKSFAPISVSSYYGTYIAISMLIPTHFIIEPTSMNRIKLIEALFKAYAHCFLVSDFYDDHFSYASKITHLQSKLYFLIYMLDNRHIKRKESDKFIKIFSHVINELTNEFTINCLFVRRTINYIGNDEIRTLLLLMHSDKLSKEEADPCVLF